MLVEAGVGFLLGWCVAVLADVIPNYALERPATLPAQTMRLPGLWHWLRTRHLNADVWVEVAGILGGVLFGMTGFLPVYAFLLLLTVIDVRYRLVPNVLVYPAAVMVIGFAAFAQPALLPSVLIGGGMAFGVFFLTALMQPGKLGGGDVKLAGLIGLAFGFPGMLWALLVGGTAGAAVAIALMISRRPVQWMPYAPFLCLGALFALIYNPFI